MLRAVVIAATLLAACASGASGYRVRAGDTLTEIARTNNTTVAQLERLNGLAPGGILFAGSTLTLPAQQPAQSRYEVQPGDTLTGLARRFQTTVAAIAGANGMKPTDLLLIGAMLQLPSARVESGERSSVRDAIVYWSSHYGVEARLATALAWMESGFNNDLVSSAGAVGVMQITPATWDYVEEVLLLGRTVPRTADGNVRVGVALLHHLLNVYDGDERLALAAYYQGQRSLDTGGMLPMSRLYVEDILALKARF